MTNTQISYYHTEIRGTGASRAFRRGQVREIAGIKYILIQPSRHRGEWVVGRYSDGVTTPSETRASESLASCPVVGRVKLSSK